MGSRTSALSTHVKLFDWSSLSLLSGQDWWDWGEHMLFALQDLLTLQGFDTEVLDLTGMSYGQICKLAGRDECGKLVALQSAL